MATILLIATLDTKGPEAQFLKEAIHKRGHIPLVMDVSSFGKPVLVPDITADEVARAAGSNIKEVHEFDEAGPAAEVMTNGASKIAMDLYESGVFQGVIAIGGGMGTSIASAVMRQLPAGIPKFMLASQKIVQAGIKGYVGTKDIAMMPSIADIAGLNRFTRKALSNAAGAIVGMVESAEVEISAKPLIFMTMLGPTTTCGLKVKTFLENKGFEVIIFHTIGIGGMTLEDLIKSYPIKAVIELGLNEIGNELFGGVATAGPERLETAGKKGIPQIITPGNVEYINFLTPETVPNQYKSRNLLSHNPQATLMRLNADELKLVGETVAKKLNLAAGPVKVLIPKHGFSSLDQQGRAFYDPVADEVFIKALKGLVQKAIMFKEIEAHINDDAFVKNIVDETLNMVNTS